MSLAKTLVNHLRCSSKYRKVTCTKVIGTEPSSQIIPECSPIQLSTIEPPIEFTANELLTGGLSGGGGAGGDY